MHVETGESPSTPLNTPTVVVVSPFNLPRDDEATWAPPRTQRSSSMEVNIDRMDHVRRMIDFINDEGDDDVFQEVPFTIPEQPTPTVPESIVSEPADVIIISYDEDDEPAQKVPSPTTAPTVPEPAEVLVIISDNEDDASQQVPCSTPASPQPTVAPAKVPGHEADPISTGLFIAVVLALTRKINDHVRANCYGCEFEKCSQKHHHCLFLSWEDKVSQYFERAVSTLNEVELIDCLKDTYKWDDLYRDDKEMLVVEAVEFFHCVLKKPTTLGMIKTRLMVI